jgi:hypothetical protein
LQFLLTPLLLVGWFWAQAYSLQVLEVSEKIDVQLREKQTDYIVNEDNNFEMNDNEMSF